MSTAAAVLLPAPVIKTKPAVHCAGCLVELTADEQNFGGVCTDDRDQQFGDCCFGAHRDLNECGCLTDAQNDGDL